MPAATTAAPGLAARALLVLLAGGLLLLVLLGEVPGAGKWTSELGNAAHGPAFAALTWIVFGLLRHRRSGSRSVPADAVIAVIVATVLGVATELLQLRLGRDASWGDLGHDALGALAASGFIVAARHRGRQPESGVVLRRAGLVAGGLCAAVVLAPAAVTGAAYFMRWLTFPTLVDFSSPLSLYFLSSWGHVTVGRQPVPPASTDRESGDMALRVQLVPRRHWTVAFWEPRPDWRRYGSLNIDLVNPTDAPLLLTVWIRDWSQEALHDAGFRGTIRVPPRARSVTPIPVAVLPAGTGRTRVDPARVHSVLLTRTRTNEAAEFYVMGLWLE